MRFHEWQIDELANLKEEKNLKISNKKSSNNYNCTKESSKVGKPAASKYINDCQLECSEAVCKEGGKVGAMKNKNSSKEEFIVSSDSVEYVSSLIWYKNLKISDKLVKFKLDTGAQINTVTEGIVKSFKQIFEIIPSKVKL